MAIVSSEQRSGLCWAISSHAAGSMSLQSWANTEELNTNTTEIHVELMKNKIKIKNYFSKSKYSKILYHVLFLWMSNVILRVEIICLVQYMFKVHVAISYTSLRIYLFLFTATYLAWTLGRLITLVTLSFCVTLCLWNVQITICRWSEAKNYRFTYVTRTIYL